MRSLQDSSPFTTMHSSRGFLVSGHEQQIFFPDFPTAGPQLSPEAAEGEGEGDALDPAFPMLQVS